MAHVKNVGGDSFFDRIPTLPPVFSEYDRRIRFRSGKCIGIDEDTGGYGGYREFAVYKIVTNEYYVVDKINEEYNDVRHSEYRINVGQETVERRSNRYAWIKVPDDSTSISSYGIGTITVKTAAEAKPSCEAGASVVFALNVPGAPEMGSDVPSPALAFVMSTRQLGFRRTF